MANADMQVKLPVLYDSACAGYHQPGHPERPQRVLASREHLGRQKDVAIEWLTPEPAADSPLLLAHSQEYLDGLSNPDADFDGDTPAYPDIDAHARRSAGASLNALDLAIERGRSFSMMRPPGHHATPSRAMGFCYLSNIAIAALVARQRGFQSVAILDFDVHHGNGTEAVVRDCANIWFASVHQSPCYPGTGLRDVGDNCFNYPVPPRTHAQKHLEVIESAAGRLREKNPDILLVSAGFDAYKGDPIAQESLEIDDFHTIGRMIRSFNLPTASILEGGYSDDLPLLIHAYLKGLTNP